MVLIIIIIIYGLCLLARPTANNKKRLTTRTNIYSVLALQTQLNTDTDRESERHRTITIRTVHASQELKGTHTNRRDVSAACKLAPHYIKCNDKHECDLIQAAKFWSHTSVYLCVDVVRIHKYTRARHNKSL